MAAIDEFLNGRDTISTKDATLSIKINIHKNNFYFLLT